MTEGNSPQPIHLTEKGETILAWVGCTCPACDWSGRAEVTQRDKKGKLLVRCPDCGERISVDVPEQVVQNSVTEAG